MVIVITEKNTIEGYTAGWVAKRALKGDCEWIQIGHGDKMPALGPQNDVLMFGVSFSRKKLEDMMNKNSPSRVRSLFVFDNDLEVKSKLSGMKNVKVNLKQTAARMAWEHLRADLRVKIGKEKKTEFHLHSAPWIVDYSEKKGLWKWSTISQFFVKKTIQDAYTQTLDSWDELATRDLGGVEAQGKELSEKAPKEEEEKEPTEETENQKKEHDEAEQKKAAESADKKLTETLTEKSGDSETDTEKEESSEKEEKTEEGKDNAPGKKSKKSGRRNSGASAKTSA